MGTRRDKHAAESAFSLELSDGRSLQGIGHLRHTITYVESENMDGQTEWSSGSQTIVVQVDDEDLLFSAQNATGRLTVSTPCCEHLGPNRWPVLVNGQNLVRTVD